MKLVQPVGREFHEDVPDYSTIKSSCRCSTSAANYNIGSSGRPGTNCKCTDGSNGTVGLRVNIG